VIMTYYYGFLFSIIVNSAIWMLVSFIVNKYYYKSTGFKDEKYLVQYGLAMINTRTKRSMKDEKKVTMKNGKPATQGICTVCGTKMFRIGK
jgi:hypothetical protein